MEKITIKGEGVNQMKLQRNLFDKMYAALCRFAASEATVNVAVGAMLMDLSEYVMYPRSNKETETIQKNPRNKYQIGVISGINIFVDPMMQWNDTRVLAEGIEITIDIDPSMIV